MADVGAERDALWAALAVDAPPVSGDQVRLAAAVAPVEVAAWVGAVRVALRLRLRLLAPEAEAVPVPTRTLQAQVAQAEVDAVGLDDLQVRPAAGHVRRGRLRPG